MQNQAQKRKFINENLNAIHDRLEVLSDGIEDVETAKRIKARLTMRSLINNLEELDFLLDSSGRR